MRTELQRQSAENWLNAKTQKSANRIGAVIGFLKENPGSTSEEIFQHTGFGVLGNPYLKNRKHYRRGTVWFVNELKWRKLVDFANNKS